MDRRGRPLDMQIFASGAERAAPRAERAARRAEEAAWRKIREEKAKRLGDLFAAVKRQDLEAIREMELNENDFGGRDEKDLTVLMHAVQTRNPLL